MPGFRACFFAARFPFADFLPFFGFTRGFVSRTVTRTFKRVGNAAAATAMPGVVFIAGTDGKLHALATADGSQIWSYDTDRSFDTVNKVEAKGGSIASIGPTIANGMLFIGSGYGVIGGPTGNVLLAFGVE